MTGRLAGQFRQWRRFHARVVKAEELANFPWTSLRFFGHMDCPEFLGGETILAESGGLADTTAGWRNDRGCLAAMAAEHPRKRDEKFGRLSKGWMVARLAMGQPATVSQYARRFPLAKRSAEAKFQAALSRIKSRPLSLGLFRLRPALRQCSIAA